MSSGADKVIVVGGGLSGLSAAHTVLERGGRVLLLDKSSFLGGNSTKATSGINGAPTSTQNKLGIKDSQEAFLRDTALSASKGASDTPSELNKVLVEESAPAVEWLQKAFKLNLSMVSRLGGHSFPRTHRGPEKFPGMTITYALMEALEEVEKAGNGLAEIKTKANVKELIRGDDGAIVGVKYTNKEGELVEAHGPVVLATGGYAADFSAGSLLQTHRPDICHLPTTNGEHCTGDGLKMAVALGAGTNGLKDVQVHPTGMVHPNDPDSKVKWLAAEALRGVGGILLDRDGNRFVNELGRRDFVTGVMWKHDKAPYRLVLNGAASKEIAWHIKHYQGRGLMKNFTSGAGLAKEIGCSSDTLTKTFNAYNKAAESKNDPFEKKFFHNAPFKMDDEFNVSIVTPVLHYCMGGLTISNDGEVMNEAGSAPLPGLFCAGELCGGIHGINRLGGSSLLDCVVFGRVSGRTASAYLQRQNIKAISSGAVGRANAIAGHMAPGVNITINVGGQGVQVSTSSAGGGAAGPSKAATSTSSQTAATAPAGAAPAKPAAAAPGGHPDPSGPAGPAQEFTMEEVSKHNKETDCWVVVKGQVLDVTRFLDEHPGGKPSIMLYAGKDATEEFEMMHEDNVISKYAPGVVLGKVKK